MNRRARGRGHRIFYGWYVLAASFVILFLNAGGRFIIGVMLKPITAELDWTRSAASAAIFLNLAVYALAIIVIGRLYDRWGPKWLIVGATVLLSAGYALMATMDALWQFFLYYGILVAAGFGGTTVTLFGSIIGTWFERRRGLAVSLATAGNCLGQFFLLPLFSDVVVVSGWRSTSLLIAGLAFVVNLALAFAVIRGGPKEFGLRPYGSVQRPEVVSESSSAPRAPAATVSVPDVPLPREARPAPTAAARVHDLSLAEAMRTRSLWAFTVAMFVCGGGDFIATTHLVPMVTDYGLSASTGASMLAWLGLLSLPGILLAGPAADSIGNKIPIALTFGLRVILFMLLFQYKGAASFWVFSLGMGLTLLVTAVLTTTLVGSLYGVTHLGFISGFINTVHMVGGGLWAYMGGVVYDRTGDYDLALLISAAATAVALMCTFLIREERHGPRRRPRPAVD